MEKKRIEFEKEELIFLLSIIENIVEDDLIEEDQVEFELINSIYLKITKSLGETLPNDSRKYLYYDHKDYTNSYIIEALEELNKKGKI